MKNFIFCNIFKKKERESFFLQRRTFLGVYFFASEHSYFMIAGREGKNKENDA